MATFSTARIPRKIRIGVLTLVLAALALAAMQAAQRQVVTILNRQSLSAIAEGVLSRAEYATDYAAIKLGELAEAGHLACDEASRLALDKAIFQAGSVKDILVARGAATCSASLHDSTLLRNHDAPQGEIPARNPRIALAAVETNGVPALALTWVFDKETKASALINTENLVFDVLPAQYRKEAMIDVELSNGWPVAAFGTKNTIGHVRMTRFEAASSRYPLVTRIEVPVALLAMSDIQQSPPVIAAAALLSLVLAFFVARGLVPETGAAGRIAVALRNGDIAPHFQPVYDTRSGAISGFEVLARWSGPAGMPPSIFVPLIEANGLSEQLLECMVEQTARSMRAVIEAEPDLTFAFNVSPQQLMEPRFSGWFTQLLARADLAPQRVIVEITEREAIDDTASARGYIAKLREAGIEVAIDDVGTGHNGLASIQGLGAAIMKIDKLFVDGIVEDRRAGAMVSMLVDIAREYGMRTIAEGVESAEQLSSLQAAGVDEVQGYYLAAPADPETTMRELARHQAVLAGQRLRQADAPPRIEAVA